MLYLLKLTISAYSQKNDIFLHVNFWYPSNIFSKNISCTSCCKNDQLRLSYLLINSASTYVITQLHSVVKYILCLEIYRKKNTFGGADIIVIVVSKSKEMCLRKLKPCHNSLHQKVLLNSNKSDDGCTVKEMSQQKSIFTKS